MIRIKQLTEHPRNLIKDNDYKSQYNNVSNTSIIAGRNKSDLMTQNDGADVNSGVVVNDKLHEILSNIRKGKDNLIYKAAETMKIPTRKQKKRKKKAEGVISQESDGNDSSSSDTEFETNASVISGTSKNETIRSTVENCFTPAIKDNSVNVLKSKNNKKRLKKPIIAHSSSDDDSIDNKKSKYISQELGSEANIINNGYCQLNNKKKISKDLLKFTYNIKEKKFRHTQEETNYEVAVVTSKEPSTKTNSHNNLHAKIQSKLSKFVNQTHHCVNVNSIDVENKKNHITKSNDNCKKVTSGDQLQNTVVKSDSNSRNSSLPSSQIFNTTLDDDEENDLLDYFENRNNNDGKLTENRVHVRDSFGLGDLNKLPDSSESLSSDRILLDGFANSGCVENNVQLIVPGSSQESNIPNSSQNLIASSQRSHFYNTFTNSDEENEALEIVL